MAQFAGSPDDGPDVPAAAATPPDEPPSSERERDFFVRLARLVLETIRATTGPLILILLAVGLAWLYEIPPGPANAVVFLLAIPLLWGFFAAAIRGLFRPREPRFRVVPCDDATARHVHRWLGTIGRLFAVFAPLAWALRANNYPPAAIDGLWLAYELLTLVALVLLVVRRGTLRALMPKATTRVGGAVQSAIGVIYPIFAIYVIGVLAVHSLGYVNLARFLGWATALSGVVVIGAAIVWKYVLFRLELWHETRIAAVSDGRMREEIAPDLAQLRGFYHTFTALARFAIFVGAGVGLLFAWGLDWPQIRTFATRRSLFSWEGDGGTIGVTLFDVLECAFIVIVAFLGGRVARSLARSRLRKSATLDRGTQEAIANFGFFVVVAVGLYFVMTTLRVNLEAVKWLGGAVGIGIGFGLQNIVNNFVSGLILLVEKPIRTDDVVEVSGVVGRVEQIGTRSTVVVDTDNIARIVPNSEFVSAQVTNWSYGDPRTRIRCPIGVAYGTDPQLVRQALLDVASHHGLVLKKPAPDVYFMEFADSSLNFELRVYVADPARIPKIRSDINYAIDGAFKKAGIEIPFPQRDLHVIQKEPIIHRVVVGGDPGTIKETAST